MSKKTDTLRMVFDLLQKKGISPDMLYVLYCIRENQQPLNVSVNSCILELERLKLANHNDKLKVFLLKEGETVLAEFERLFSKAVKTTAKETMGEDYEENIKKYLEIFPKMKLPNQKPARVHPKNLLEPFKWFFETYEYDWEIVLAATEKYVDEYRKKRFLYMHTSQYFVRKQQPDKSWRSELADWCENIKDDGYESDNQGFFNEKVV